MDRDKNTQDNRTHRDRASLRGKGHEILLGGETDEQAADVERSDRQADEQQQVDPAALSLSPDETDALLDFSMDEPPFDPDLAFPDPDVSFADAAVPNMEPSTVVDQVESTEETPATGEPDDFFDADAIADDPIRAPEPDVPAYGEAVWNDFDSSDVDEDPDLPPDDLDMPDSFDLDTSGAAWLSEAGPRVSQVADAQDIQQDTPPEPQTVRQPPYAGDALPLGERGADDTAAVVEVSVAPRNRAVSPAGYTPAREIDALVPLEPEQWNEHEGGAIESADVDELTVPAEQTKSPLVHDPFVPAPDRPAAKELFDETQQADSDLLDLLVGDNRIKRLADRIETMQEELATDFYADRVAVDTYQRELLQANGMLLESRENYDDARAIVYRIRTDMNRHRKIDADIARYRPLLLNYYIGWVIALGVLFLLKSLFTGVTDAVGLDTAAALYYPTLLGAGGALISGFLTLERHTTRLRDFDPIHISWYLSNPLLGAAMGLLMFLIASIANEDLLRETASDAEYAITYLLCVVAGMNQNNVLRRLNDLLERFGRGGNDKK